MPKQLKFDEDARAALLRGVNIMVKRLNGQEVDGRTVKVESRGSGTTFSLAPAAFGRDASEHSLVFSNSSGARSSLIHRST
jgi:hypothetical protein